MLINIDNSDPEYGQIYTPSLDVTVALGDREWTIIGSYIKNSTDLEPEIYYVTKSIVCAPTIPVVTSVEHMHNQVREFEINRSKNTRIGVEFLKYGLALVYCEPVHKREDHLVVVMDDLAYVTKPGDPAGQQYSVVNVDKSISTCNCPVCGEDTVYNADYDFADWIERWQCSMCGCEGARMKDNPAYIRNVSDAWKDSRE